MSGEGQGRSAVCGSVFLVSLAALTLELTLTRLFSATMFYHFAFLGHLLAPVRLGGERRLRLPRAAPEAAGRPAALLRARRVLFAVTTAIALVIVLRNPLPLEFGLELLKRLVFVYAGGHPAVLLRRLCDHGSHHRLDGGHQPPVSLRPHGAAAGCLLVIPGLDTWAPWIPCWPWR